ncbi:unnamed protein product [Allacma fusca]|uniref:Uncharacterized protein n=1 Tax=Allacma fusca TaxID=39272 RepID=A0A8J2LP73_9HEXA|nr:unnamed protein product [Allacma fusca]
MSQWLPSPAPVPKQSHSARRFAKPTGLVNLSSMAVPPHMSPLLANRSNPLGFPRYRKNLEFAKNQDASNRPTRQSLRKVEKTKQEVKASQRKGEKALKKPSAEGKALLETPNEATLQLIPVSSLSLVKCPGSSSNAVGERMQVVRTEEERSRNPETIRLDKCGLKQFPLISPASEHNLKLLSMQHNQISKLENVPSLNHLVVLDLYDNRIERISGLQGLSSLRVLLLGKNR